MKRSYHMIMALLACGVLVTGGLALSSESDRKQEQGIPLPSLTFEEAIAKTKVEFPGRVIEIELEQEQGKTVYEIEIASKTGIVTEVVIDAQSGQFVSSEIEEQDDEAQERDREGADD